jgi:hypothetical protein
MMLQRALVLLGSLLVSLACGSGQPVDDPPGDARLPLSGCNAQNHAEGTPGQLVTTFPHLPPGGAPGECMVSDAEGEKSWGACP